MKLVYHLSPKDFPWQVVNFLGILWLYIMLCLYVPLSTRDICILKTNTNSIVFQATQQFCTTQQFIYIVFYTYRRTFHLYLCQLHQLHISLNTSSTMNWSQYFTIFSGLFQCSPNMRTINIMFLTSIPSGLPVSLVSFLSHGDVTANDVIPGVYMIAIPWV